MTEKASVKLPGTVENIIEFPGKREKAQIVLDDNPCGEIRIDNSLTDHDGEEVRLKKGAKVTVTVKTDGAITAKP
jgi:hypothetical protein